MVPTSTPGLSWLSNKQADEFVVRLYNSQGLVWEKQTGDPHLEFPEDEAELTYGESYFWNVEGVDLITTFMSQNQKFTVLTEEKKLYELFSDDLESSSHHSLLGAYYATSGLYENAIKEFEMAILRF